MTGDDDIAPVRAVYDASAASFVAAVGTEVSPAFERVIDRAFLSAFVERVGPGAAVADVGCGPGRVASLLAAHGVGVTGVDVSPAMLEHARAAHPGIRFEEGRLDQLPFPDGSLAGVASWYSIIHTPPEHLSDAFGEIARVLQPTGHLLLGFQAGGGEGVPRDDAYGSGLSLTSYRHDPDEVERRLVAASFGVHARATREPELAHESSPQAFLLAVRTAR